MADESIKEIVKQKYGQVALRVTSASGSCCSSTSGSECDPVTSNLYAIDETSALPAEALAASRGCGNPTALAELRAGEVVLDLGSGGGIEPGGGFAVWDVVVRGEVPAEVRRNVELWIGCVAGALEDEEYRSKLAKAGFEAVDLEPTRVYRADDAAGLFKGSGIDVEAIAREVDGKVISAFVRARKPPR